MKKMQKFLFVFAVVSFFSSAVQAVRSDADGFPPTSPLYSSEVFPPTSGLYGSEVFPPTSPGNGGTK